MDKIFENLKKLRKKIYIFFNIFSILIIISGCISIVKLKESDINNSNISMDNLSNYDNNTDIDNINGINISDKINGTIKVIISDFDFKPKIINISAGTTIIWINNESVAHSVKYYWNI